MNEAVTLFDRARHPTVSQAFRDAQEVARWWEESGFVPMTPPDPSLFEAPPPAPRLTPWTPSKHRR